MNETLLGNECIFRIHDESVETSPHLVAGVRVSSWSVTHEDVEVTDSSDAGWRRLLSGAGVRALHVQLEGVHLRSFGELHLRAAALSGKVVSCELALDQSTALQGEFIASTYRLDNVFNEEASYSVTLRSAGPITIV